MLRRVAVEVNWDKVYKEKLDLYFEELFMGEMDDEFKSRIDKWFLYLYYYYWFDDIENPQPYYQNLVTQTYGPNIN